MPVLTNDNNRNFTMMSVLLKYFQEHHLPRYNEYLSLRKRALFSATHEIVLYVYLQYNRYGVDFLLYRESHHLPRTESDCEISLSCAASPPALSTTSACVLVNVIQVMKSYH